MTNIPFWALYDSPLGLLLITATPEAISSIEFVTEAPAHLNQPPFVPACLEQGLLELKEYFSGARLSFSFPMQFAGTAFQQQVWELLATIPFGQTVSYQWLAVQLNNPGAIRAIGSANNKNKLAIVLPCHRVIGSNGQLVGYAGGLWRKQWLLHHERTVAGTQQLTLF
jgi:methylated-DNA-[protein]-cysteine S-methyltransferase